MFLHKAIDLTDWEAASFAVLQSHGNQTAENKNHNFGAVQSKLAEKHKNKFRKSGGYFILFYLNNADL